MLRWTSEGCVRSLGRAEMKTRMAQTGHNLIGSITGLIDNINEWLFSFSLRVGWQPNKSTRLTLRIAFSRRFLLLHPRILRHRILRRVAVRRLIHLRTRIRPEVGQKLRHRRLRINKSSFGGHPVGIVRRPLITVWAHFGLGGRLIEHIVLLTILLRRRYVGIHLLVPQNHRLKRHQRLCLYMRIYDTANFLHGCTICWSYANESWSLLKFDWEVCQTIA